MPLEPDGFNLIISGGLSGLENMELDARLLKRYQETDEFSSLPTLRVYYFSPPALSLGFFQKDADARGAVLRAEKKGYDIVRRPTGGRAVLHKNEITYAVISSCKEGVFSGKLMETYRKIGKFLFNFFKNLGLNPDNENLFSGKGGAGSHCPSAVGEGLSKQLIAKKSDRVQGFNCFLKAGSYEITFGGKKICGSAQRRTEKAFLQHGSIYMDYNPEEHLELFEEGGIRPEYFENITGIRQEMEKEGVSSGLTFDSLSDALVKSFQNTYGLKSVIYAPERYVKNELQWIYSENR